MKTVEIQVTLTDAEAWEFAQFLKRVCFSDYRAMPPAMPRPYRDGRGRRAHPRRRLLKPVRAPVAAEAAKGRRSPALPLKPGAGAARTPSRPRTMDRPSQNRTLTAPPRTAETRL